MPRGWELAGCAMLVLVLVAVWGYQVENGGWRGAGVRRSDHMRVLGSIMAGEGETTVGEDEVLAVLERAADEMGDGDGVEGKEEEEQQGDEERTGRVIGPAEQTMVSLKGRIRRLLALRERRRRRERIQ